MKKIFFIAFMLLGICRINCLGQKRVGFIDSVKIYSVPLSLKSNLALSSAEVVDFDPKYKKVETLKYLDSNDSIYGILDHLETESYQPCKGESCIDVRIVVEVSYKYGDIITISLDGAWRYELNDHFYKKCDALKRWLMPYIIQ